MAVPCGEMYVPTVVAQWDVTGTPLRVLGAKASGGKPLPPTQTYESWCGKHTDTHSHLFLSSVQRCRFQKTRTYADTYTKAWRKMGAIWPPGSLPIAYSPCWVCPVGDPELTARCTAGCLGDAVLETMRLGLVCWPWRPWPSDRPQRQSISQTQAYAFRHGRLFQCLCNLFSHGLNLKGPEKNYFRALNHRFHR